MQALKSEGVEVTGAAFQRLNPRRWEHSLGLVMPGLLLAVEDLQTAAVNEAGLATVLTLGEQGRYVAPDRLVNPAGFAGMAPLGNTVKSYLLNTVQALPGLLERGVAVAPAMQRTHVALQKAVAQTITDSGRQAASVEIAARQDVGYIRMANPPTCYRCIVLVGKFFWWNSGFQRHPLCDCQHVPAHMNDARKAEGFQDDPYQMFKNMSPADQVKAFGEGGAAAINDGADIYQVANARLAQSKDRLSTTAGTTRFAHTGGVKDRVTPDAIYEQAKTRGEAIQALEKQGYILKEGQVPGGALRGSQTGYGERSRAPVRDGSLRGMTAAEQRAARAEIRWRATQVGQNPYNRKKPLTQADIARAQTDLERYVFGMHGGDPALAPGMIAGRGFGPDQLRL